MIRALLIVIALAGAAHADGWWEACKCNNNGDAGPDAASVGSGLGLVGLVGYRLSRRRA